MNLYNHNASKWKMFVKQIVKATNSVKITLLSGFAWTLTYEQNILSDPYLYKALSNRFYKWITSAKLIISINLAIKMYRFQKNGLFGA